MRGVEIGAEAEEFFRSRRLGTGRARLRLLALTYEFNLRAFERAFDSSLHWPIMVDIVVGAPEKSLRMTRQGINAGLRIWRARWKGTFHPKLLLLLSKDEVVVGIGSANLTSAGLGERLETWRYFTAADSPKLLAGILQLPFAIDRPEYHSARGQRARVCRGTATSDAGTHAVVLDTSRKIVGSSRRGRLRPSDTGRHHIADRGRSDAGDCGTQI